MRQADSLATRHRRIDSPGGGRGLHTQMKRIAWILAVVLGCVLALLVLLVALVPREALKVRMSEQIASWTGRDVSLRGEPCTSPGRRGWTTRKSSPWTG